MKELVNSDRRLPNFSVWSVKAIATQQHEGASEAGADHAAMSQFILLANHDASWARRFAAASRKAMAEETGKVLTRTLKCSICWAQCPLRAAIRQPRRCGTARSWLRAGPQAQMARLHWPPRRSASRPDVYRHAAGPGHAIPRPCCATLSMASPGALRKPRRFFSATYQGDNLGVCQVGSGPRLSLIYAGHENLKATSPLRLGVIQGGIRMP